MQARRPKPERPVTGPGTSAPGGAGGVAGQGGQLGGSGGTGGSAQKCDTPSELLRCSTVNIAHRGGRRIRPEHTIEAYDQAINIDSDYESAWTNKGNALGKTGRYKEAIDCYDKAIAIKNNK